MAEHNAVLREGSSLRRESRQTGWRLWLEHSVRLFRLVHLLLFVPDAESVRRRYHGQFRLPDEGLVHTWCPPLGRVRPYMGRIRPKRDRQDPLHGDVRHAEEHGSAVGVWKQMSEQACLQEAYQDEHAGGRRLEGELHHHFVRPDPRESQYKSEKR